MKLILTVALSILRVAFVGDPQVDDARELAYARASIYAELKGRTDLDLVVILGDLVNDKPELLAPSKACLDSLPCPWICAPGNHDKDIYSRPRKGKVSKVAVEPRPREGNAPTLAVEPRPREGSAPTLAVDPRPRDTRTFRRVLGYTDTTFVLGGICFISMDNVRTVHTASYEGGLSETQKDFLRDALSSAPGEIVLCAHIPFSQCEGRDSLAAILSPFAERLLIVCGHTHFVSRGTSPFGCEEVQAGATCGTWWRGVKGDDGIPLALMNCGAPRGYFVADFKPSWKSNKSRQSANTLHSGWYSLDYKCVGRKTSERMSVSVRDSLLFVNVYGGSAEGKVVIKYNGRWHTLDLALQPAPEVMDIIDFNSSQSREYRRLHKEEYIPMRRIRSPHVWSCPIPKGNGRLKVWYTDPSGPVYKHSVRL